MTREKENLSTYHDEPFSSATILQTLWAVKVLLNQKLLFLLALPHIKRKLYRFLLICVVVLEIQSSVGFARIFESFPAHFEK
jgi:hypothetical protein